MRSVGRCQTEVVYLKVTRPMWAIVLASSLLPPFPSLLNQVQQVSAISTFNWHVFMRVYCQDITPLGLGCAPPYVRRNLGDYWWVSCIRMRVSCCLKSVLPIPITLRRYSLRHGLLPGYMARTGFIIESLQSENTKGMDTTAL